MFLADCSASTDHGQIRWVLSKASTPLRHDSAANRDESRQVLVSPKTLDLGAFSAYYEGCGGSSTPQKARFGAKQRRGAQPCTRRAGQRGWACIHANAAAPLTATSPPNIARVLGLLPSIIQTIAMVTSGDVATMGRTFALGVVMSAH